MKPLMVLLILLSGALAVLAATAQAWARARVFFGFFIAWLILLWRASARK